MKKIFFLNSTIGVMQVVIGALLYLITIPIFLKYLNSELYGIYALISTLGSVSFFINFGFNLSIIKFVGEQGPGTESDKDILLAFFIALFLVCCVACFAIAFSQQILNQFLFIPDKYLTYDTFQLFKLTVLANVLLFVGQIPIAVIDSQQKIYLSNLLQVGYVIINRISMIIVVIQGGGLLEIGIMNLLSTVIWFFCLIITFAKVWHFTSLNGFFYGFRLRLKKHFSFGGKVYMTSISGFFYEPFAKILIGKYIGLVEVGIFDIGFRIKTLAWNIIEKSLYPLVPIIAGGEKPYDSEKIIDWISRKIFYVFVPLIGVSSFIISPLIKLWIGPNNSGVEFTARVLLCGYLFTAAGIPIYLFLILKGHVEKTLYIQLLNAIFSVLFFLIFVPHFGYQAAVFSFVGAVLCTHLLLLYFQKNLIGSNIFYPLNPILKSAIAFGIIVSANVIISIVFFKTFQLLVAYFFVDAILFIFLINKFNIFTLNDLKIIFGNKIKTKNIQQEIFFH